MGIGEDKIVIDKFDGSDFSWWKKQIDALLAQKDLDTVLENKPQGMTDKDEALWKLKDKKARGIITLALSRNVAFSIDAETTAQGMMTALVNQYEKPSAANKVFLMRELFMLRMKEGSSVSEHVNNLTSILSRLASVGMKYDDETRACLLLSSLPDSWSGYVTAVTNSMGSETMTYEKMREGVLGEATRRRNATGSSSTELLHAGRGDSRASGSGKGRRRGSSRGKTTVRCWDCNEKGHVRTECPNKADKGKTREACVVDYESDDVLLLSESVDTDAWVMDSGASLHASHSVEGLRNIRLGDFGRVRLGTGEFLEVTGLGDLDLKTSLGTIWTLRDIRIVPKLKARLISVSQLDRLGLRVSFGNGEWKVVKGNLIIARGLRIGSLYLQPVPSGKLTVPKKTKTKTRLAGLMNKRVRVVVNDSTVRGNRLERFQGSEPRRVIRNSGSTREVPTQLRDRRWVRKTDDLEEKFSPDVLLVGSVPLHIPATELWGSVGIEDVTVGLRPAKASTGPGY